MKKRASAVAFFLAAGLLSAFPASGLEVKDKLGRTVEVSVPVRRAVMLSLYEFVPALDLWASVAGINRWAFQQQPVCDFPQLRDVPQVGTGFNVNVEALLALRPDVTVTWSQKPETVEFLARRGLKVVAVYPESLGELYEVMEMCGRLFQKEDRVREVRAAMEETMDLIRERVSNIPRGERRRVLFLWQKPTRVSGSGGLVQDVLRTIGAENAAGVLRASYSEVSMERILEWDPETVFIWGHAQYQPETLLRSAQWRTVSAVKSGRIYKAPAADTWSPSVCMLALWMAQKTYPERFQDVRMRDAYRDFHSKCFGIAPGETPFE